MNVRYKIKNNKLNNKMQKDNRLMLGYDSLSDLFNSAFGLQHLTMNIIGGFIAGISAFITRYIWNDEKAIYVLLGLITFDAITGIGRAIKHKTFSSARLPRILVIMVLYTGLLSLGWNLSHVSTLYAWIPSVLYGGFVTTLLISIFENMNQLGYIPDGLYNYVKVKIELLQTFLFGASYNKKIKLNPINKIGIYHCDVDGNIKHADIKLLEMTGLSEEKILSGGLKDIIHSDDIQNVSTQWGISVKSGMGFKLKFRMKKDSNWVTILSQANPIKDKKGLIIGYLGTFEELED